MSPRILEYEDGRIKVTAEAYAIPELKAILDKYDMNAEPYLSYVHAMSAVDSPYINIPSEEKQEAVIYDITNTLGEFDFEDEILQWAIDKMKSLYMSKMVALAEELGDELDRIRVYLRSTPIMDGEGGNLKERMSLMKDIDRIALNYSKVREQADKELRVATKGDHEVGEY